MSSAEDNNLLMTFMGKTYSLVASTFITKHGPPGLVFQNNHWRGGPLYDMFMQMVPHAAPKTTGTSTALALEQMSHRMASLEERVDLRLTALTSMLVTLNMFCVDVARNNSSDQMVPPRFLPDIHVKTQGAPAAPAIATELAAAPTDPELLKKGKDMLLQLHNLRLTDAGRTPLVALFMIGFLRNENVILLGSEWERPVWHTSQASKTLYMFQDASGVHQVTMVEGYVPRFINEVVFIKDQQALFANQVREFMAHPGDAAARDTMISVLEQSQQEGQEVYGHDNELIRTFLRAFKS